MNSKHSATNSTTINRIKKEIKMTKDCNKNEVVIDPCYNGDIFTWRALIKPSKTSIYHNTVLELLIKLPQTYPYSPPCITFITTVFHPNINSNGAICISVLGKDWSPALTVEKAIYGIFTMLDDPNPWDPLCPEAAELFISNKKDYYKRVRERCELSHCITDCKFEKLN